MTKYEQLQHDAAIRFLRTGLIVDDRASTDPSLEKGGERVTASLMTPKGPLSSSDKAPRAETTPGADGGGAGKNEREREREASIVNVKRLADRFADIGLTCGMLKPEGENHDKITKRIVKAARGVDIVVLDWMLEPNVFTAEKAVIEIVAGDSHGPRVLAIYTTQRTLADISAALKEGIADAEEVAGDDLALDVGGTRIVIYHKGGPTLDEGDERYLCEEDELPNRLVDVFIEQAQGLVPAVALNAVAATRENAHRLLCRLAGDLDLGYLGHILRLSERSDAGQHLLDAISGEFQAVIEDDEKTTKAAIDGSDQWLESHEDQLRVSIEALWALAAAWDNPKAKEKWRDEYNGGEGVGHDKITSLLVKQGAKPTAEALESDARFAQLMAMRRPYSRANPPLRLGTITRERDQPENYWLCMQPVCDSVRLSAALPTNFLMLPLQPVEGGTRTAFVVDGADDDGPVRLWLWKESSDLELMRVRPSEKGAVRFKLDNGSGGSRTLMTEDGVVLAWAGQLKPTHALRVAHEYGNNLSRVGLDESEWLRVLGSVGKRPTRVPRVPMVERVRGDN
jgi:hypothetical protein